MLGVDWSLYFRTGAIRPRDAMNRSGKKSRRLLEFEVVMDQVKRRKDALIARIQRWTRAEGECVVWHGAHDGCGYGVLSFKYMRKHIKINVPRIVLIMQLGTPIPESIEAGHTCGNRACIRHIEAQHYKDNLLERDQRNGKDDGQDQIAL